MKTVLPEYLKPFVAEVKEVNEVLHCKIRCSCNHDSLFTVCKNILSAEEQKKIKEWEKFVSEFNSGYSDKDGNLFLTKKNFFGRVVKKVEIDKKSIPKSVDIIKIKCANCGKEFVIFDSSKHGYDAFTECYSVNVEQYSFLPIKYKNYDQFSEVEIKIKNDLTYEEFCDNIGENLSKEDYSNAFSFISIEASIDGKKVEIFSKETA